MRRVPLAEPDVVPPPDEPGGPEGPVGPCGPGGPTPPLPLPPHATRTATTVQVTRMSSPRSRPLRTASCASISAAAIVYPTDRTSVVSACRQATKRFLHVRN